MSTNAINFLYFKKLFSRTKIAIKRFWFKQNNGSVNIENQKFNAHTLIREWVSNQISAN